MCCKHLYDVIISLRMEVWAYSINLIPPLFIEVPASRYESDQSYIYVREVDIASRYVTVSVV